MFDLEIFCGDSGYVACVEIDGKPFTWDDMPESVRDYLRSRGMAGLQEWTQMQSRIDSLPA